MKKESSMPVVINIHSKVTRLFPPSSPTNNSRRRDNTNSYHLPLPHAPIRATTTRDRQHHQHHHEMFVSTYSSTNNSVPTGACDGKNKIIPIIILHGGPGYHSNEDDFDMFIDGDDDACALPLLLVRYDQRFCGQSRPTFEPSSSSSSSENLNGGGDDINVEEEIVATKFSIEDLIEDLDYLRRHLGFEKIILFGHSWGTLLATAYAAKHPQKVGGLILYGSYFADSPGHENVYGRPAATHAHALCREAWNILADVGGVREELLAQYNDASSSSSSSSWPRLFEAYRPKVVVSSSSSSSGGFAKLLEKVITSTTRNSKSASANDDDGDYDDDEKKNVRQVFEDLVEKTVIPTVIWLLYEDFVTAPAKHCSAGLASGVLRRMEIFSAMMHHVGSSLRVLYLKKEQEGSSVDSAAAAAGEEDDEPQEVLTHLRDSFYRLRGQSIMQLVLLPEIEAKLFDFLNLDDDENSSSSCPNKKRINVPQVLARHGGVPVAMLQGSDDDICPLSSIQRFVERLNFYHIVTNVNSSDDNNDGATTKETSSSSSSSSYYRRPTLTVLEGEGHMPGTKACREIRAVAWRMMERFV